MALDPITGEEVDDVDLASFYDQNASFPNQDLVAQDQLLGAQVPAPNFDSGQVMGPVQTIGAPGAATQEFLSGRPGLFIQGGPSVPSGQIMVNDRLERSQAAPQPLPWWIREADQFKEQRRQEDEALRLAREFQSSDTTDGSKAMSKARQLQGRLQLQADIRAGVPLPEAYARAADKLYGDKAPHAVARLVGGATPKPSKPPFMPTSWTSPEGVRFTQTSPNQFSRDPVARAPREAALTPGQQLDALRAAAAQAENAGDTKTAKELMGQHNSLLTQFTAKPAPPKADASKSITRLLNKKTGKTQIYTGNPADVPTDRFEILK